MKKTNLLLSALVIFVLILPLALPAQDQKEPSPQKSQLWKMKMAELYQTLSDLLPDLVSHERFYDQKNYAKIQKNAEKLTDLSHLIAPDADPSIGYISNMFEDESKRAVAELKRGNRTYARNILQNVTGYCIACHSRNNTGPQFPLLKLNESIKKLSRFEKAEFFAATRQYDQALEEYQAVLADPKLAQTRPIEWERAARNALAVGIRVKNNADTAMIIADRVMSTPTAPLFLRENATAWKKNIEKWKTEPARKIETTEGLYAEANRLIAAALEAQQYPADRSGDVFYLRASATLHDLLGRAPKGKHAAEALLLSGIAYEALRDMGLWSLHEFQYKGCILAAPHTDVAKNCYTRLEESIYAGYSGSGGVSIPADVLRELKELKKKVK